jgi:adenine-specific DNA-methyltransferase
VRRFSSKEERRRVVACVVDPAGFSDAEVLGFENHLNVFHETRHGMPEHLAKGLAMYLNTTMVDESFRQFSGHTQVNATDLKLMRYPSREALISLGMVADSVEMEQEKIDEAVAKQIEGIKAQYDPTFAQFFKNLGIAVIIQFVMSLIFAAIFKKETPVFASNAEEEEE